MAESVWAVELLNARGKSYRTRRWMFHIAGVIQDTPYVGKADFFTSEDAAVAHCGCRTCPVEFREVEVPDETK